MAIRTTPALVMDVLAGGGDYTAGKNLSGYIRAANIIVDRVVTMAAEDGDTLTDAELAEIETWLAAWAYKQSDQQAQSTSNLRASATNKGTSGMYFENNNYGQTALLLDWTGNLWLIQKGSVQLECGWLGTPGRDQQDWTARGN